MQPVILQPDFRLKEPSLQMDTSIINWITLRLFLFFVSVFKFYLRKFNL